MAASTPLDEISTFLAAASLGLALPPTAPANLFAGRMFDTPDVAVALLEYSGEAPGYFLGHPMDLEMPRMQVLVRGVPDDYYGPRLMANKIVNALDTIQGTTLSGVRYLNIDILQPPFELERDEKERVLIAVNISIWKAPSPTA